MGTLLLGVVGVYNAVTVTLAKIAASRAARHVAAVTTAVATLDTTVRLLEVNTNSKMDDLMKATNTVAGLEGEKRGAADELARQNKEPT